MIFCKDQIFAKVWEVKKEEKYLDLQITTSEKDRDGKYINSGWFPRVIGHAFNTLKDTLKKGDRIVITKCKLSNERYTDKNGETKSAFRFIILEAEIQNGSNETPEIAQPKQEESTTTTDNPW